MSGYSPVIGRAPEFITRGAGWDYCGATPRPMSTVTVNVDGETRFCARGDFRFRALALAVCWHMFGADGFLFRAPRQPETEIVLLVGRNTFANLAAAIDAINAETLAVGVGPIFLAETAERFHRIIIGQETDNLGIGKTAVDVAAALGETPNVEG